MKRTHTSSSTSRKLPRPDPKQAALSFSGERRVAPAASDLAESLAAANRYFSTSAASFEQRTPEVSSTSSNTSRPLFDGIHNTDGLPTSVRQCSFPHSSTNASPELIDLTVSVSQPTTSSSSSSTAAPRSTFFFNHRTNQRVLNPTAISHTVPDFRETKTDSQNSDVDDDIEWISSEEESISIHSDSEPSLDTEDEIQRDLERQQNEPIPQRRRLYRQDPAHASWIMEVSQTLREKSFPVQDKSPLWFKRVVSQWIATGEIEDLGFSHGQCELCQHQPIRYEFQIYNPLTEQQLYIGSSCIKHMLAFGVQYWDREEDCILHRDEASAAIESMVSNVQEEAVQHDREMNRFIFR